MNHSDQCFESGSVFTHFLCFLNNESCMDQELQASDNGQQKLGTFKCARHCHLFVPFALFLSSTECQQSKTTLNPVYTHTVHLFFLVFQTQGTPAYFTDQSEFSCECASTAVQSLGMQGISPVVINPFRSPLRVVAREHNMPWFPNAFLFSLVYTHR